MPWCLFCATASQRTQTPSIGLLDGDEVCQPHYDQFSFGVTAGEFLPHASPAPPARMSVRTRKRKPLAVRVRPDDISPIPRPAHTADPEPEPEEEPAMTPTADAGSHNRISPEIRAGVLAAPDESADLLARRYGISRASVYNIRTEARESGHAQDSAQPGPENAASWVGTAWMWRAAGCRAGQGRPSRTGWMMVARAVAFTSSGRNAEAVRTITLTFKLKPDDERRRILVTTSAQVKLAAVSAHKSTAYTGKGDDGRQYIFDQDPRQDLLWEVPAVETNILPFAGGTEAKS